MSFGDEVEVHKRIQAMREDDLVTFIRDTVLQLEGLADRLEKYVPEQTSTGDERKGVA